MDLIPREAVTGAEAAYLSDDSRLLSLALAELALRAGKRAQVVGYERADRAAALGSANASRSIDIIGNGNSDVGHCDSQ
jgi:hypothetical protein